MLWILSLLLPAREHSQHFRAHTTRLGPPCPLSQVKVNWLVTVTASVKPFLATWHTITTGVTPEDRGQFHLTTQRVATTSICHVFSDKNNTKVQRGSFKKKTCPKSHFLETAINIWNKLSQRVSVLRNGGERTTDNSRILFCKLLLSKMMKVNFLEKETEIKLKELLNFS